MMHTKELFDYIYEQAQQYTANQAFYCLLDAQKWRNRARQGNITEEDRRFAWRRARRYMLSAREWICAFATSLEINNN